MLSIVQASKSRRAILFNNAIVTSISSSSVASPSSAIPDHPIHNTLFYCSCPYSAAPPIPIEPTRFNSSSTAQQVVESFKEWFHLRRNDYMDHIFAILGSKDEVDAAALSQLGFRLNEQSVLDVLRHGFQKNEILSCLKFFDWAGRQRGYSHTRTVFRAIFKSLSRAKLMSLLLDFLDTNRHLRNTNAFPGGFRNTLVLGYAVAGKPQRALQLFGEMRFRGQDLDSFTYHALLGSLVEEGSFDAANVIAKQISLRGFENHVTHSILVKSLCKQKMLDKAGSYLRQAIQLGDPQSHGGAVGVLVNALCKKGFFDRAEQVIEEFKELGVVPMDPAYNVFLRNLVQANKLDEALELLKRNRSSKDFVPENLNYHKLLCRLMNENRLSETCDLLMNMMEEGITPDKATMDIAFRFFCKSGMVDVALELYKCRSEISLSPTDLSYSYLINNLCKEGYSDEAYNVFLSCAEQGYFPAFSALVDSLCRENKLDKVEDVVLVSLREKMMPSRPICDKLISALCRAGKYEEHLMHEELSRMNKTGRRITCSNLIQGSNLLNKGDVAARLLTEMQETGHKATRMQFRVVIRSLCDMPNPEIQFLNFLARQLSYSVPNCEVYNNFIDGAAHAEKPHLAREVFELMKRRGIQPNLSSYILVLQSYLKSNRIPDAVKFFEELRQSLDIRRKLFHVMIVGLSEANREDIALNYLTEMRNKKLVPTNECYEVLVLKLCYKTKYDVVVDLVKKLDSDGRQVTSFLGNTLLSHCLKSGDLYDAWIRETEHETSSYLVHLGQLLRVFSGHLRVSRQIGDLEEMIKKCFPLDLYTYNMLLRRLIATRMDCACELFNRLHLVGFEPDLWSYYILYSGFLGHGRTDEARRLADEMVRRGFDAPKHTNLLGKSASAMTR